jgi:hypothetical protein
MLVEGSVKRYLADSDGASSNTLATCLGVTGAVSWPGWIWVDRHGVATLEVTEQRTCGLPLIVVVNAVIVALAATVAFGIVEIAAHLL